MKNKLIQNKPIKSSFFNWLWLIFIAVIINNIYLTNVYAKDASDSHLKQNLMHKVLVVRTNHTYKAKAESLKAESANYKIQVDSKPVTKLNDLEQAAKLFEQYDLVMFEAASKRETKKQFEKFAPVVKLSNKKFVALKWFDSKALTKGLQSSQAEKLFHYYDNGGSKNFSRMAEFLLHRVFNLNSNSIKDPIIYPEVGIYHPNSDNLIFANLKSYQAWNDSRFNSSKKHQKTIGIMMQRALVESSQTDVVDATIKAFEQKGAKVIPFFFEVSPNSSPYFHLVSKDDQSIVDVIVNFRTIHWANKRKAEFKKMGVPIIQALTYFDGDQQQWENDPQGISAGMTPFLLVLPETAGVIDPIIVAARNKVTERAEVIDYQLEHLVNKAFNQANLRHKPNNNKKITVFFWGDRDMGASFLNVPDSLHVISHKLNEQGYQINAVEPEYFTDRVNKILDPFYRDFELNNLLNDDLAELMPVDEYLTWFNQLPQKVTQPIITQWGEAKDNFMVIQRDGKHQFVLPRIRNGNMLVLRQPPRADDKDQDKMLYHKGEVPMNHYYLAAYYYARKYWNSDAIIHLGTHGSQEYLGGKERGLSRYDGPNLAVWDTPVLYPFIVDDVGEAMQTKRRGSATVLSHMTPPFAAAGLQGDSSDIHELMHQYKSLDEGGVKVKTADQIIIKCIESNICKDLDWSEEQIRADFARFLDALHDFLGELGAENQPLGLHSYGELAEKRLITSTLVQMMGAEFTQLASEFEAEVFHHKTHSHDGVTHSHAHEKKQHNNDEHYHESEEKIEDLAGFKTVSALIVEPNWHKVSHLAHESTVEAEHSHNGDPQAEHSHEEHSHKEHSHNDQTHKKHSHNDHSHNAPSQKDHSHNELSENSKNIISHKNEMSKKLKAHIEKGKMLFNNLSQIKEIDYLLAGLNGQFIPVKTGGDPIRHPESVPTGFNLYGFDPARLPTKAAYEQGKELVEQVINDYYKAHKKYPDKLAFSLWSIEAMRHYGVLESQALYAMGVKPKWSKDGRVIGTEIIAAKDLKRPRVDVVLSATGLYRDAFPNVIQRLAKAIEQVAKLKEENNSIWQNSQRIQQDLINQGYSEDEAIYLSSVRVFSNGSGQYGSGTDGPVFASDTWETDAKIAENYLSKMGAAFGSDPKRWGQQIDGLNLYAKQLSGTDIAMFSRSSNVYGMLSSDDPFEYFGSLSMAVRNLDGKSPKMLISNLRDASKGKMVAAAKFLAKELRTRQFHKRWISEMQKEGYSGAVTMSSQISNFWGWQVVDPNLVRADQWQEFHEIYVEDKLNLKINEWFEQVNPSAQAQIIERMLEAVRKNYWQASDTTKQKLVERYLKLVNTFDIFVKNEKLKAFVNQSAQGYGLNAILPEQPVSESIQQQINQQQVQQVAGQKLEKVEQTEHKSHWNTQLIISLIFCVIFILLGGILQARRSYQFSTM